MQDGTHPHELLLSYMEAGLEPDEHERVGDHVESCASCRAWCETFTALEGLAQPIAEHDDHPDADLIARFSIYEESLDREMFASIESHVGQCDSCRNEVELVAAGVGRRPAEWSPQHGARDRLHRYLPLAASLLLVASVLAFATLWPGGAGEKIPLTRHLQDETLAGDRVIESQTEVSLENTEIAGGSTVTLRAGETVSLGNGFSIAEGASLSVAVVAVERDQTDSES